MATIREKIGETYDRISMAEVVEEIATTIENNYHWNFFERSYNENGEEVWTVLDYVKNSEDYSLRMKVYEDVMELLVKYGLDILHSNR